MSREVHVRFWESAEVRSLRATRQLPTFWTPLEFVRFASHNGLSGKICLISSPERKKIAGGENGSF